MVRRLSKITVKDLGPFVGEHAWSPPPSGMVLVRGRVEETGGGSGSGKSFLLNAIPFVLGRCPFPATEMQSWYSERKPGASLEFSDDSGTTEIGRSGQLRFEGPSGKASGKAADAFCGAFFGLDGETLGLATYRAQKAPGAFLDMGGPEKVAFLSRLLHLERAEQEADAAAKKGREILAGLSAKEASAKQAEEFAGRRMAAMYAANAEVGNAGKEHDLAWWQQRREALEAARAKGRAKLVTQEAAVEAARAEERREGEILRKREIEELDQLDHQPSPGGQMWPESLIEAEQMWTNADREVRQAIDADHQSQMAYQQRESYWNSKKKDLEKQYATLPALLARIEEAKTRESSLEQLTCPTCVRPWPEAGGSELAKVKSTLEELCAELELVKSIPEQLGALDKTRPEKPELRKPAAQDKLEQRAKVLGQERLSHETAEKAHADAIRAAKTALRQKYTMQSPPASQAVRKAEVAADKTRGLLDKVSEDLTEATVTAGRIEAAEKAVAGAQEEWRKADEEWKARQRELEEARTAAHLELDLAALLGREGFLGTIVDEVLGEVADEANTLLGRVANTAHLTLQFDLERETKSNTVVRRIELGVLVRGRRVPYRSGISGGMQTPVELAVDLGLAKVVSRRTGSYPGWLILDEALNGLGPVEKSSALEMLQGYAEDRLVMVVDHDTTFQGLFHETLEVVQRDGRSSISVAPRALPG